MYKFIGFSLLLHGLLVAVFLLYGKLLAPTNLYLGGNSNTISIIALNYSAINKSTSAPTPAKPSVAKPQTKPVDKPTTPAVDKTVNNNTEKSKKLDNTSTPTSKPQSTPKNKQTVKTNSVVNNQTPTKSKVETTSNAESAKLDNTIASPTVNKEIKEDNQEDNNKQNNKDLENNNAQPTKKPLEIKDLNQQDNDSIKKYLDNNKQNTVLYNEETKEETKLEDLPLSNEDKVSLQQALYGCGYNINLILDEDVDINLKINMNPDASIKNVDLISYKTNSKYNKQKILYLVNNIINALGKEKCKYLPLPLNNYSGWVNFTFKLTIKGFFNEQ